MKGLILLFLSIAIFGIVWGYMDRYTRSNVKAVVRKNLLPITLAIFAVAVAVAFSINTTLRLV